MKFRTSLPLPPCASPISYESKLLLLGSCFVTNMGNKFEYYKFDTLLNPFGILYHPLAIGNLVRRALEDIPYTEKEIFFRDEGWHCHEVHSALSRPGPEELLDGLNNGLKATRDVICTGTHIMITLGTAWVYRKNSSGAVVANCHKIPQKEFSRELLSPEKIRESLETLENDVRAANKKLHCLFTISPVRHLKDGFVGNQRSKARLINALHDMLEARAEDAGLSYFPAYEILLDELRDYRFYEDDLLHPNSQAINYVWEVFRQACIDPRAYEVMDQVEEIRKGLQHRPFNPRSESYRQFRKSLEEKMATLSMRYPVIKFEV